ncbi:MAG: hypothetical protein QOD63_3035 [Actinomycetota bacterium]|jgi:uncharacterized repeat protein (TIGR03847 family)|nr:hypothetical protein [Actinomycetota bacterium]
MSASFELSDVERLTVGTEGPPGKRIFYLQAATSAQVVTLRLEKTQVAALVAYLSALLSDLPTPTDLPTEMDLVEPVLAEWVVGSLGVTYDEGRDRILLLAEELVEEGEDGASIRLLATRAQVAALAVHGAALVAAGRPPCQLCGLPLDPEGHVCPRLNGHRSS